MNILIVKLSAIGDVIHTLPSLAALRRCYPEAHISWVVEEAASDLLADHPMLDRVLISRRKRWVRGLREGGNRAAVLREIREFLRTLRDRPYDLVIDFHGLFKSAVVVFLSGGRRRLGYDSLQEGSGLFLNEKIPEDMTRHAVDRYLDFPRHLGCDASNPVFPIAVTGAHVKRVQDLLAAQSVDTTAGFVAISPVAYWETKLWDEARFAAVCDRIVRELGLPVVFTGEMSEGPIERIRSLMRAPSASVAGATTLRELAALYRQASVLLTTDSGPMHLAAAVGTPVVALFGPTSPERTGPYGAGHAVIRKGLTCSPCFRKSCETMECMKAIGVDEVFRAVRDRIEQAGRGKHSEIRGR
ncbi:MAG TPA: glycosyltransferase family 9 protein [Sedimentisphaerales bacterium]|nr:glycosyltransferase family 9 protein [Sedimentisphaerales bacterium]